MSKEITYAHPQAEVGSHYYVRHNIKRNTEIREIRRNTDTKRNHFARHREQPSEGGSPLCLRDEEDALPREHLSARCPEVGALQSPS